MALIAWRPQLALQVPELDDEHRDLVAQLNRLEALGQGPETRGEFLQRLDELLGAARRHFANEERLLREAGIRGEERHLDGHRTLLEEAAAYREAVASGSRTPAEVTSLLCHWLTHHVFTEDVEIAARLRAARRPVMQ